MHETSAVVKATIPTVVHDTQSTANLLYTLPLKSQNLCRIVIENVYDKSSPAADKCQNYCDTSFILKV